MKKSSLLLAVLALGAQSAGAHYTNKTFLLPRNQGLVNLPLEMTTFQERIHKPLENRFGGSIEAVGFYGQNTNKHAIGTYFGAHTNSMKVIFDGQALTQAPVGTNLSDLNTTEGTLDVGYIIHDVTNASLADNDFPGAKISLSPESSHYGVDFVYYQDLAKIVKGLYFKINVPVECVSNNPHLDIDGGYADATDGNATKANLYRYFAGHYTNNSSDAHPTWNAQNKLTAAKIDGKRSATGVADIDVMLGYDFLKKAKYFLGFNVGLSIPTGRESSGEYLFEPIYGSKSFGFGGGLQGEARLWGCERHNLKINMKANYRYMFEATQKRIPGILKDQWGQYELLASMGSLSDIQDSSDICGSILTPAANVLNQVCNVTPGSQLDAIVGFAYNNGGFNADLGYNLYVKEAERVKTKTATFAGDSFTAAKSLNAVSGSTAVSTSPANFGTNQAQADGGTNQVVDATHPMDWVIESDVRTTTAATPSQLTNGVYAGLGYAFKDWKRPMLLGIGGKYEFAAKNSALEVWQCWAKVGVSF